MAKWTDKTRPVKIEYDDIKPAMDKKNWDLTESIKVEVVNGTVWASIPAGHELHPNLETIRWMDSEFYTLPGEPGRIMRVVNSSPDIVVYLFTAKTH